MAPGGDHVANARDASIRGEAPDDGVFLDDRARAVLGGRKRARETSGHPTNEDDDTPTDSPAPTPGVIPTPEQGTPMISVDGVKKKRNSKPKRIQFGEPPPGVINIAIDPPNGRYNKNGVCHHKASGKWRAIVYVNKKQVNLGYFTTKEESEETVRRAREFGLPPGFVNCRAHAQPKRSAINGVNWDKHCKRWLARVYEPTKDGKKGKEHKVGYYDDEEEAGRAIIARRKELGLPEKSTRKKREKKTGTGTVAAAAAAGAGAAFAGFFVARRCCFPPVRTAGMVASGVRAGVSRAALSARAASFSRAAALAWNSASSRSTSLTRAFAASVAARSLRSCASASSAAA